MEWLPRFGGSYGVTSAARRGISIDAPVHVSKSRPELRIPGHRTSKQAEVEKYIQTFFADWRRDPAVEIKRAQVPQGTVHAAIGRTLDSFAEQYGNTEGRVPAGTLLSNIYRTYSNYVHAKYPEVMDLYGGRPGRFHLRGMSGTPKDAENLEILATCIGTASNTFVAMVQRLNLRALIEADPITTSQIHGSRTDS